MDWLSRKLVLWQIKKYFHLEDEQQIQVQLLGQHSLTCNNLKLRNSVVNAPTAKLHIQQLTINSLTINYTTAADEPLRLALDGAKLVLAFNPAYQQGKPSYANTKQQLREFFDAIKSKDALHHRGFVSEEVFQLKKLVGEFFIKKVSLLIKNVDVSVQYNSDGEVHALGCELGEVNIKQRVLINHDGYNEDKEMKEEEVICTLEAVSLYLGISSEQDKIEHLAHNRQILRKTKTIRKNYLLEREQIQIYYNINKNALTLTLPQLSFRFNKLLIVELARTNAYMQMHLSDRPMLRPGKGELRLVESGGVRMRMREGTFQWWGFVMKRILERVEEKKQFNILTNYKYRLYLFYLIYRFTIGSNSFVDRCIAEYQEKKLAHSIMSSHAMVLSRINTIRSSDQVEQQMLSFVNFICTSKMVQDICNKNGLKNLSYQKIRSSKVYFNLNNCNQFIREAASSSNMSISVNVEHSIRVEVHESKYDQILLKEGFTMEPADFYSVKRKYISKFYKKMTEEGNKWDNPFFALDLAKIQFFKNRTETKLIIPSVLLTSEEKNIVMKVQSVVLFKENKTIYAASNKIIVSEKNNYIKVSSVYFNIDKVLVQHLLTIKVLLSEHAIEPLTEQEEFDSYLEENIYKRLPKHPFFESFSDQSTNIEVKKMLIVTSLFEENHYITVELNGIEYSSPINNKPPKISLEKLSVSRSRLSNFDKLLNGRLEKLSVEAESVMVENNKPLALTSNKYLRKHNGYIYYESVLDIIIPFILIQISFQDIYFFQLAAIYWSELFSNQYLFPRRKGKTQTEMKVIEMKQNKIDYFEMLNTFTKSSRTRVKLQGIELILYGQNNRSSHNEFLTMLIEGILYENKVYILGMDTNITIFNIFVENCLAAKTFNQFKLLQIIEKRPKTEQPLIYSNKYETESSCLLLYGLNQNNERALERESMGRESLGRDSLKKESKGERGELNRGQQRWERQQTHMIKLKMKNQFSMKKFRKITNIYLNIKPLFIFHSSDYYQILTNSLNVIAKTAAKNFKRTFPPPKATISDSDHEILEAKNISQKTIFVCEIQKVNLIALHQNEPIYTFSLLDISVKHETESYVTKFEVLISELYVVDISLNCGLHPIVIKAVPVEIYFTNYESDLLRKKEKKSALLKISLHNSELFYLNRKIKELTNFIMSHFEDSPPSEEPASKQKLEEAAPKVYPFCYRVEFIKPVIMLLRGSLSEEKMASEAQNLLIANYLEAGEEIQPNKDFFFDASRERFNNDSFESCIQIREQEIQFHSFAKAEQEEDDIPSSELHINLLNFYIYSSLNDNNTLVFTPQIVITLVGKHLRASLKTMNINFTSEDYRLLIRITEQNFSETPVSYPKDSIETEYKSLGFKSSYCIEQVTMSLREKAESQKFGELFLTNIIGENIMYTNGEKEDIIRIEKLEYQSCINNNLEKIIAKKEKENIILQDINPKNRDQMGNKTIERAMLLKEFAEKFCDQNISEETEKMFFEESSAYHFDGAQKDEGNQQVRLRGDKGHTKEETNLNRVGKWIKGMCKKCMCCCKNEAHEQDDYQTEERLKKNRESLNQNQEQQRSIFHEDMINLQESYIESPKEMINFSMKVNPDDYKSQLKSPFSVYMHIKGEKSREKRMYMLTQHLNIYYEKNMHIMTLINFLNKPYSQPERPEYLRQAKFNNYRPFQMLIEVSDTSIFAVQKEALNQRSLELDVHLFYNLEKLGDPTNGPGKKLMETDLRFQMFFQDMKTFKRTALSDPIRLIHTKQANVSYHNRQPIKNIQRLLMLSAKPPSRQDLQEKKTTVKFNFPIYIIKSLVELVKSLQAKPKSNPSPKSAEMQNQSMGPIMTNKTYLQQEIDIKRTQKTMAFEAEKRTKSIEKKGNQVKVVNSVTFKKFYIPNIELDIQTKQNVSFITLFLQHIHLKNRQMAKQMCDTKNQIIDVDVSVSYWNLNLGKFEPFLEKCKFIVQQQSLKRDNTENTKLKVITKSQKDMNAPDYRNGLCINLTTAFFHTYKELQLKYLLQNQRLEISNEICYDLTRKNTEVYEFMKMKKEFKQEMVHGDSFQKNFPEELKNFFGRRFKVQDLTELCKKKGKRSQVAKNKFHIEGLKVFLYHSYLEPSSKLKFITYRTPFRIYNITPYKIQAKFTLTNRNSRHEKWSYEIGSKEYYSIPEDIYQSDFLVNLAVNKKKHYDGNFGDQQLESSPHKAGRVAVEDQEAENTMPVKYLVQMNANKSEYNEMGKHKLNDYIFNLSTLQKRWIDKRDTVISSNNINFCLINVKSQCEEIKDKVIDGSKIIPYDSLTIIISPIIIYNYTSQSFNISNCKKKKYELRPSKSVELNEFPPGMLLRDVVIEFMEDPAHHEYDFLRRQVGIKNETMLIDRNQSVNIRTIKETYNTCLIEIYPDWLITNETELEFHLLYDRKEIIINQKSMNSLAIDNQNSKSILNMKIKLIDDNNDEEDFHKFGTETGLVDIFILSKVEVGDVKDLKQQVKRRGCCGKIKDKELLSDPTKAGDERVFKCIQFVVNIQQSMNYLLTKNLNINYKYWIVNEMDFEMSIYQYALGDTLKIDDGQENGIEIIRLKPKEQNYLYTYDFLSKQFYLKVKHQDEFIYSNLFLCDQSMGRSLSLKLKKNLNNDAGVMNLAYHETFHHIRIDMGQVKYTNILTFTYIEEERTKYPFYISNATNYFVKIKENGESFKIRPKTRVPFSWSNLVNNTHKIEVEIEGQSMTYSLKEKTYEFEPIVIKGDNIANKSSKNISSKTLFKRESCLIKWKGLNAEYLLIFDIFAKKLHINSEQPFWLSMNEAQRLVSTANKIEIYFKNREIFQFYPSQQTLKDWADLLRNFLNSNVIDKIYFTIESLQNSMIYFIHNLEINNDNDIKIDHRQYVIQNFYLSVINSNPLRIEEIVLINMENIEYIQEDRLSEMRKEEKQSYLIKKAEQTIKIKKFKINNQLKHALNPVILSQIKKSNYPFLEIKREKQNLVLSQQQVRSSDSIEHYKSSTFFLDEAQLIIEAALIPELLNFKKNIDQISSQYSYNKQQDEGKSSAVKQEKRVVNNQIYIDYLEIKPIKMTISVSFDANIDKQFEPKLMNFLTMIPAGVENAIITIDSFMFHHVFMEDSRLKQTLRQYYLYEMKKQILFNAGSIQILTPFQLIRGLGIGFTSIFYNPFYELVSTKEIKSFTSNFLEGFITLIIFIFSMGFSLLNSLFKFLAVLTKDNNFQTRRQKFRKQIFKSPIDGFSYGARYWTRVCKQFFINFVTWPCEYNSKAPCIGLLFGFILSILYILVWIIKMLVTTYDFFYVIGLGFLSWGFYQQNSMKYRTRPIRTFPHKRLLPYDYLTAKGNEIMRRNLIQQNDNEEISFISHIEAGDESKYLLLSNYRILYCSHELTSFKEITLYKVSKVVIGPLKKNTRNGEIENLYVDVNLTFPDQYKCLCIDCSTSSYELKFKDLRSMKEFLDKLQTNLDKEHIDFNLENENLKLYERSIENESIKRQQKMIKNESSNRHEIPLSQSKARS